MADMAEMHMPLPDNTLPMMTGDGPFGSVGMGGMFSMLKVRKDQKPNDYTDPGWFKHPAGTVAYEFQGTLSPPKRSNSAGQASMNLRQKNQTPIEVQVRKPTGHP